ncbi:STAS domain-containing protein [Streptomyces acidiscabies]|uniref:STAS domain-containing protein n=1 Tax=Streptomyces acidiscabies TaxID=42234 RepID=UPI0038F73B0D
MLPAVICVKDIRPHGDCSLVVLCGEIDIHTAPGINHRLDTINHAGNVDLLVDLRAVDFMDGTGVRLLERARARAARHGGRLRLICTNPVLLRLLNFPQLHLDFDILGQLPAPVPPQAAA